MGFARAFLFAKSFHIACLIQLKIISLKGILCLVKINLVAFKTIFENLTFFNNSHNVILYLKNNCSFLEIDMNIIELN